MNISIINACLDKDSCLKYIEEYIQELGNNEEVKVDYFYLSNLNIKQCLGCNSCAFKTPGVCIHKDDVADILRSVINSDRTIFIYSLHKGFMNSLIKKLIDRFYLIELPYIIIKNGAMKHKLRYEKFPEVGFVIHPEHDTTIQEMTMAKELNAHLPEYYQGRLLFNADTNMDTKELAHETTRY